MLELMVPTTLARGLLMLSPRLMLSMVPMDTLLMVDTHTLMVHIPPMVLIPTMDEKENYLHTSKNNLNRMKKTTAKQKQYDCHQCPPHNQCLLSSAALL